VRSGTAIEGSLSKNNRGDDIVQNNGREVVRVLVLDADVLAQYGLQNLFSTCPNITLAQLVKDVSDLKSSMLNDVDVVILSLESIRDSGAQIKVIRELASHTNVLVMSAKINTDLVEMCLTAGARGYVWKGIDPKCICEAVLDVINGKHPIMPPIAGELLFQLLSRGIQRAPSCKSSLTQRETEVLHLVAEGMSNKEIAVALNLSVRTVKAHVSNVLRKLQVADRTQAAVLAIKTGTVKGLQNPAGDKTGWLDEVAAGGRL
jgi:DNA-binding NarL/FixJ family response regulator